MPIYEYECNKCEGLFEHYITRPLTDEELMQRVDCSRKVSHGCTGEGQRITSLTSPPQFNGPGFHATDYKGVK
jgi:predicted nucleic acid-binding Zn ribbon protein